MPVEQAERRNLIMVNPVEGNLYATTRNLVSAYQCVKGGETARTHRHTPAALLLSSSLKRRAGIEPLCEALSDTWLNVKAANREKTVND